MLPTPIPVTTQDGINGVIDPAAWLDGTEQSEILVTFEDGTEHLVPTSALEARMSGGYWLMMNRGDLRERGVDIDTEADRGDVSLSDDLVIPVIEEEASVRVVQVPTGAVRVHKTVHTREEQIEEPLYEERVDVQRRTVDREVDTLPEVRHEGDTMIIPVVEEVIVKRYIVREEVLVTKKRVPIETSQTYTLRHEEVTVERLDGDGNVEVNTNSQGETV